MSKSEDSQGYTKKSCLKKPNKQMEECKKRLTVLTIKAIADVFVSYIRKRTVIRVKEQHFYQGLYTC